MTRPAVPNQGCPTGKRRYRDRVAALVSLSMTEASAKRHRRQHEKRRECRAYKCPKCRGWHLTSRSAA